MYSNEHDLKYPHSFCPRCDANLSLQKGYDESLNYWICKGCGEMLINPSIDDDSDIAWICDNCGEMLNVQIGFSDNCEQWICTKCGFTNKIDVSELYPSEDEYLSSLKDPYKGMSDEDVLELSYYQEIENIDDRENITVVYNEMTGETYVKKVLKHYDVDIYRYVQENPISHMPKVIKIYEGTNYLIVLEEYIPGIALSKLMERNIIKYDWALKFTKNICEILDELHHAKKPIIHRDVKPSNIIVSRNDEIYLLDMNVAKWYKPDEVEDTKLLGTMYYAAPEQFGYGFSASSDKTDIYAIGVLLNVMLTGVIPKEKRANGRIWNVIEKCIRVNPEERYTAKELIKVLDEMIKEN